MIVFSKPAYELNKAKVLREFDCSKKKVHILMKSNLFKNGSLQIKGEMLGWQGIDSEP